jgi:hypothetical protein
MEQKILRLQRSIEKRLDRCIQLYKNGKYESVADHLSTIVFDVRNLLSEVKKEQQKKKE